MRPLLLKVQFNLVPADTLKNHGVHPVPLGKRSKLPGFSTSFFKWIFPSPLTCKERVLLKSLPCSGILLSFYELLKGGACKINIQMTLKSRSYILDLGHVKLSFGIFFFLSCLIERIFHQLPGSTFIVVKNTHQKAANLMFCLISPVAQTPAWFLEGQFRNVTELEGHSTACDWIICADQI